jgi:chromosomal replication initiation ATPase DnaA
MRRQQARKAMPGAPLSAIQVATEAAEYFGLSVADLVGRGQQRDCVGARRMAATKMRSMGYSTTQIGHFLGRDHSTIISLLGMRGAVARREEWRREAAEFDPDAPDFSGEWAI